MPTEGRHGGTLSTAGGLVFWGTDSRLVAVDARTGRELWAAELDGSPGSPVSYSAGGRQYVVVGSGQASGRSLPRMWAFALGEGGR